MKAGSRAERGRHGGFWSSTVALCFSLASAGCSDKPQGPTTGSNSNWLVACDSDGDCAGATTACVCGACTRRCDDDRACEALPGARCAGADQPSAWSQCASRESAVSMCLPACTPGSCRAGQACVEGSCVVSAFPDTELCAGLDRPEADVLVAEEELLASFQAQRVGGGTVCPTSEPAAPVAPLRLDPRLRCAARFLAGDIRETRAETLVDSLGRGTPERLALTGYEQRIWVEAFELAVSSADEAVSRLLSQDGVCTELVSDRYADVGVGRAGDVAVLTVAAE